MKIALAALVLASTALAADAPPAYREGWTYASFYAEVAACRSAVVASAAQAYLDKGAAAHRTAEDLRSELISLMPALDLPASNGCYCAVGEVAKSGDYAGYLAAGDASARLGRIGAAIGKPPCADRLRNSMDQLQQKAAIDAVRLK